MKHTIEQAVPVRPSERYIILDALRGFALLGICLANFPEFSLYNFLDAQTAETMSTFGIDRVVRFIQYILVDGKFYTIFSLLFGIGFSIIISNAMRKGADGFRIFCRRMSVLIVIGLIHLMLIWSGDILMLYALLGLLLPLFRNVSDKALLMWAGFFLFLPVIIDFLWEVTGVYPSATVVRWQQYFCAEYGITDENFAYWLRDARDYGDVFEFLVQGALVRLQEFIDGSRYFKVFGLFLIGFYIGRKRMYAGLSERKSQLKKMFAYGMLIGLPLSVVYAWSAMFHHPLGLTMHSFLYFISVYLLGFAYVCGLCLLFVCLPKLRIFSILAAPGRMALTNYIGQSVIGMFLFYGIGMGYGAGIGLALTELIVLGVFLFQIIFSYVWLKFFRFGPLEWVWRMLTYGKWFALRL